MGLWEDFTHNISDVASRAFDQVNPWDNGKDWNNRTGTPVKKKREEIITDRFQPPVVAQQKFTPQATPRVSQPHFKAEPQDQPQQPAAFGQVDTAFQAPSIAAKPKVVPQQQPDGAVLDTRPMPARVPNDHYQQANEALKAGSTVKDVGNYWKHDADALRAELTKPNPDKAIVQGLTQSIKNRQGEISRINTQMSTDERDDFARKQMEARGGKFVSSQNKVADIAGEILAAPLGLVTKPAATIAASVNEDAMNRALNGLNDQYRGGAITQARLQEEVNKLTKDVIGKKIKVTENGIEQMSNGQDLANFAGDFVQQGVNSYVGGGTGLRAALTAGEGVAKATVGQLIKESVKEGLKQSAITGTLQTSADALHGNEITPMTLLANYGIDAGLNVAGDLTGKAVKKFVTPERIKGAKDAMNRMLRANGSTYVVTDQEVKQAMEEEVTQHITEATKQVNLNRAETVTPQPPVVETPVVPAYRPVTKNLVVDQDGNLIKTDTGEIIGQAPGTTQPTPVKNHTPTINELLPDLKQPETKKPGALSPESQQLIDDADKAFKHEYEVEHSDLALEAERLKEQILDPATPDDQVDMLVQQMTDYQARMKELDGRIKGETPVTDINRSKSLDVEQLSQKAKNSLANDTTGIKPNGVERSGGFVENGNARPVEYRTLEDGSVHIVDGRHTLEYARQNGITDFPLKDVTDQYRATPDTTIDKLPNKADATSDHLSQVEATREATHATIDEIAAKYSPEDMQRWNAEMQAYSNTGADLSPEAEQFFQELNDAVYGPLYGKSARAQAGELGDASRGGLYAPQYSAKYSQSQGDKTQFGSTFIDSLNSTFGSANSRMGQVEADDLLDPITSAKNYTDQVMYDNYGHLKQAAELKAKGYTAPEQYLQEKEAIAKELAASVDKELEKAVKREANGSKVKVTTGKITKKGDSNLVKNLQANFDKHANPAEVTHSAAELPLGSVARTNREIWKRVPAGDSTVYEKFGMNRYENANGQAYGMFEEAGGHIEGIPEEEFMGNIHGLYETIYQKDFADIMRKGEFDARVEDAARQAFEEVDPHALANLERKLAGEQMVYHLERTRFTDPKVSKYLNAEANYLLRDSRRGKSLGDAVTNFLTGMFHAGALGLNPQSAVQQITELARVYGVAGGKDTIEGIYQAVKTMKPGEVKRFLRSYGLGDSYSKQMQIGKDGASTRTSNKITVTNAVPKAIEGTQELTMKGFNAFETAKDVTLLKALEQKHKDIADPYLRRQTILNEFHRVALKGGHFGAIQATNNSNFARLALQFGQYTMKDWGLMAEKARANDWGYVTRTLGGKAVTSLPLYAIFGTGIAGALGLTEYKGGPTIGLATNVFTAIQNENKRIENDKEQGRTTEFNWDNVRNDVAKKTVPLTVPGGNYLLNKFGVQDTMDATDDLSWLRHDTAVGDLKKGYNEAQKGHNADGTGNARFATPDDLWGRARLFLGGAYNSDEARAYFGNSYWDVKAYGVDNTKEQTNRPVSNQYQKKIDEQSAIYANKNSSPEMRQAAKQEMVRLISSSNDDTALKSDFFKEHPNQAGIYKEMTKTTWNENTKKYESDVISPEKWKALEGDTTGNTFAYLKQKAEKQHKEFGTPIDPIYKLADKGQLKEAINLRAMYTGDDKEKKGILRNQAWYKQYQKDLDSYYDQLDKQAKDPDSDFGPSARAKEYQDLGKQYPKQSALYDQYTLLRYGDGTPEHPANEEAGKAFYKANADTLNADHDKYKAETLAWTNKMRKLEGADPISADVWNNSTYGFNPKADDDKKNGYSSRYGGGSNGHAGIHSADFGNRGAGSAPKMASVKIAKVGRKATVRSGTSKGKITVKRGKML